MSAAPVIEWIGDIPIMHGERDVPIGHPEYTWCLCGYPNYLMCPEQYSGGILSLTVGEPYMGRM